MRTFRMPNWNNNYEMAKPHKQQLQLTAQHPSLDLTKEVNLIFFGNVEIIEF